MGPFYFVPCIPPFWGAFVYLWLARFHQIEGELPTQWPLQWPAFFKL